MGGDRAAETTKLKEAIMDKHFQAIMAKARGGPEASPLKSRETIHKMVVSLA